MIAIIKECIRHLIKYKVPSKKKIKEIHKSEDFIMLTEWFR